ncbi:MAG: hypothetical protein Kow00114_27110 [Kiloniellaceae bacterium]
MATTEELKQRLAEAEAALHKLLLPGATVVSLKDANGDEVQYRSYDADIRELRRYIAELKTRLRQTGGFRAAAVRF